MHLALRIELEQHALPYLRQVVRHKLSIVVREVPRQANMEAVARHIAAAAVRRADRRRIAAVAAHRVAHRRIAAVAVALRRVREVVIAEVHPTREVAHALPIRVEETLVADSF